MSSSASETADRMLRLGAALGPVWKRHRRALPPDVRESFTDLLARIGAHAVPKNGSSAAEHLGNARSDIRTITEFLRLLATRGSDRHQMGSSGSSSTSRLWSEIVDDEECEGGSDTPHDALHDDQVAHNHARVCVSTETQTDHDLANTTVVSGEAALVNIAVEMACSRVLGELVDVRLSLETEFGGLDECTDDLVDPVGSCMFEGLSEYSAQGLEDMSELAMLRGRVLCVLSDMCGAVNVAFEAACSELLDSLVASRASIEAEFGNFGESAVDLVDPVVGCSAFLSEYSDRGDEDVSELRMLEGRVHDELIRMYDAVSAMLPADRSHDCSGGEVVVNEHVRLSRDPSDPCRLVLSVDPEWQYVPSEVSDKARDILCNFPRHLEDIPLDGMSEYDIVLNEIFARPATASSYVSHLREIQGVCDSDLDTLCATLGSRLCWHELSRELVARGLRREGQFSLFDLIEEIGDE